MGIKGPTLHEAIKKELALTKDLMKDYMVEWKKNGCSIMLDGWTDRKERTLVKFLVNYSKGTMFMQSIYAFSMIETREKMFELLEKWVEQVGEENVIQVITDNHLSYVMAGNKYYFLNFYLIILILKFKLFILRTYVNLLSTMSHREVARIKAFLHLYWTPCAAHCLDLILEDIGKLPNIKGHWRGLYH